MDAQKLFKIGGSYYEIHKQKLLEKGYIATEDTNEYTIFVLVTKDG